MRNIYKLLIFIQLSLIVLIAKGQSTCATAVTLTPGTAQCGTNSYVGSFPDDATAPTNPCASSYNDGEYWFKYVGTGKALKLDVSGLTATYSGIFVLNACPSASPTCIASYSSGYSTANYSITTQSLTNGHTYYIVIANYATPYSTDFCLNSTVIPVYSMANGSTITSCAGVFQDPGGSDVYPNSNNTITETFCSGTSDALKFIFTEFATYNAKDSLRIYNGPTTASPLIGTYYGTTSPGTIISSGTCLTFAWTTNNKNNAAGWTANFSCVTPPPNNECANATSLTVNSDLNCGTVTHGTTQNATASSQANSCSGTADDDVWYKFVATSAAHKISLLNITGSSTDMYFAVYSGSCGSLTNHYVAMQNQPQLLG